MTLKEIFKKIDEQRAGRLFVVRTEARGRVTRHEFDNVVEAMRAWDKWAPYGLCVDPRPSL